MKKVLIVVAIVVIIGAFLLLIYPVWKNDNYEENLMQNIYDNTNIENISYLNKSNNYYILKTDAEVIVLDLNYEELFRDKIDSLYVSELDLVYRRNKLFYEESEMSNDKLIYNYYDAYTYELVYTSNVGGV